jgi:hypothetical protein
MRRKNGSANGTTDTDYCKRLPGRPHAVVRSIPECLAIIRMKHHNYRFVGGDPTVVTRNRVRGGRTVPLEPAALKLLRSRENRCVDCPHSKTACSDRHRFLFATRCLECRQPPCRHAPSTDALRRRPARVVVRQLPVGSRHLGTPAHTLHPLWRVARCRHPSHPTRFHPSHPLFPLVPGFRTSNPATPHPPRWPRTTDVSTHSRTSNGARHRHRPTVSGAETPRPDSCSSRRHYRYVQS